MYRLHTDVQSMCAKGAKTYGKCSRVFNTECGQSVNFDSKTNQINYKYSSYCVKTLHVSAALKPKKRRSKRKKKREGGQRI